MLDRLGRPGLGVCESGLGGLEDARVEECWIGLDLVEEETGETWELAEPGDLLLYDRRGLVDSVLGPIVSRFPKPGEQPLRVLSGRELPQVDAVHPVELRVVERRRARADTHQGEALDELVSRHERRLAVRCPAEQREEVHERLGHVPRLAKLVDRDRAVPLRELAAVGAEDVRHVGVDRRLDAKCAQHVELLRRVRDVIVAADHVRDPVEPVLERRGVVVSRPTVRAHKDEILELGVRELDPTLDCVLPARHPVVRHSDADRALVLVGRALRDEPRCLLPRTLHSVELECRRAVPVDAKPEERALDLGHGLLELAARVGVLDPEEALPAAPPCEEPVEEKGADTSDVEKARRRRSHADSRRHASLA